MESVSRSTFNYPGFEIIGLGRASSFFFIVESLAEDPAFFFLAESFAEDPAFMIPSATSDFKQGTAYSL
jgi:hypothetical protein